MASLCCDVRHKSASARWQPAQVVLPTYVAAEPESVRRPPANGQPPRRSANATPAATMIAAAPNAAIHVLALNSCPAPAWSGAPCAGVGWAAAVDFFRAPLPG